MALQKTAVFLASRFEEFADLRAQLRNLIRESRYLQLDAIDLNDGAVSHRPPLAECLSNVRRSEFMILLLGETYGSLAPKTDKSFTHWEYLEAIAEGSNTRVLAFCIGASYRSGMPDTSPEPKLGDWQRLIEENHTVKFFGQPSDTADIAKQIVDHLKEAVFEMRFGAQQVETAGDLDELTDEDFEAVADDVTDDSEVRRLEAREAQTRGVSLLDDAACFKTEYDLLRQPASVAALEQREEAQRAIDIRQYGTAILHLRRALELKPLDLMSNYWLAQLYVALGRKKKLAESIELAERAAHIAQHDGATFRAASSYLIAARAAQHMDEHSDDGLVYARQAVTTAPRYARAHIELARQLILRGRQREAVEAVLKGYDLHAKSLTDVIKDPIFRPLRKDIEALIHELKRRIRGEVENLMSNEARIAELAGMAPGADRREPGTTLPSIIETGRASVRRQFDLVQKLVLDANRATLEVSTNISTHSDVGRECFPFKHDGALQILRWLKQPGDVLTYEDPLFEYRFEGRTQEKRWTWRGKPAQILRHLAKTGESVTPAFSGLFEYVSHATEIAQPTRGQELALRIERARTEHQMATDQRQESEQGLAASRREGLGTPGAKKLTVGAVAAVSGGILLTSGSLFFGSLMLIVAIALLFIGWQDRGAYHRSVHHKEEVLAKHQANEAHCLGSLHAEESALKILQDDCSERQLRASEALKLFETSSLRKPPRLIPFGNIFSAKPGDVIRVQNDQISKFESQYGRAVHYADDLPAWLVYESNQERSRRLYRVAKATPTDITLSRMSVWNDLSSAIAEHQQQLKTTHRISENVSKDRASIALALESV